MGGVATRALPACSDMTPNARLQRAACARHDGQCGRSAPDSSCTVHVTHLLQCTMLCTVLGHYLEHIPGSLFIGKKKTLGFGTSHHVFLPCLSRLSELSIFPIPELCPEISLAKLHLAQQECDSHF